MKYVDFPQTDRQTDRQTDGQANRDRERHRQTDRRTGRQRERQTETDRRTDRQTETETDRQTDRQTDIHRGTSRQTETERQTDRQTDRQMEADIRHTLQVSELGCVVLSDTLSAPQMTVHQPTAIFIQSTSSSFKWVKLRRDTFDLHVPFDQIVILIENKGHFANCTLEFDGSTRSALSNCDLDWKQGTQLHPPLSSCNCIDTWQQS